VDGTEIGTGKDAEYFRDGLMGIFGEGTANVNSDTIDVFRRRLGTLEVEGVDWRHVLYEAGVSDNWGKYGFDDAGSVEDERYKWYAGKTQSTNVEAYELLESGVEPSTIISDEEYTKIELLRKSFKTHIADAVEGVVNKEEALAVAKELFKDNAKLSAAQKRSWYEVARGSNIGATMLAAWSDPYTKANLIRQNRTHTMDVSPSVDTSMWGILKNSVNQQFSGSANKDRLNVSSIMRDMSEGTTEEDLNLYIQENDIAPDVAAKMYDKFESDGFLAATEVGGTELINRETNEQSQAIEKKKGVKYLASMLVNEAAPYLVDPTSWVAGGKVAQLTAKGASVAFSKVSSPLVRSAMTASAVGGTTGLTESLIYTANNYRDFTNEELLNIWATDTGYGAAFGSIFAIGETAVRSFGKRAKRKSLGEGVEDIDYVPTPWRGKKEPTPEDIAKQEEEAFRQREEENQAFEEAKAFNEYTKSSQVRLGEMQEEVKSQLATGKVDTPLYDIEVDDYQPTVKPAPKVDVSEGGEPSAVDTRTPEDIEADELEWQASNVEQMLKYQEEVVRPKIEDINSKHNVFAKVHRWLGNRIGMQEFASKLILSKDNIMSYIGSNILESGAGVSGKVKRNSTAALIKDSIYTRTTGNHNEAYHRNIKGWVMQQGGSRYKRFKAAWEGGKVNQDAQAFHRAAMLRQEKLNMGYKVEPDEYLDDYLRQIDKNNDELFEGRVNANVKGFDAKRRIKHYLPHVWKKVKVEQIVKKFGKRHVIDLLTESIESAKRAGKIADNQSTSELAEKQFNWINGLGDSMEHTDTGAGISGRGKSRIPLDFTVEKNGLSMLDLIDTDLPTVMDSYTQRAAADIGISKATNGLIRSEGDFEKFLTPSDEKDKLLVQDARDLLYGRPTRQGMAPEMRAMMDLVTVQQMGGIGVAQLAETGTMAQRLIVNYMSQPAVAKKIWAMAGESMDDKGVLHQVRSIAAVNDNMEYINRYSVNNIDQAQVDELSDLRAASIDAVDKVTLGAYKAQFGRMLGSLSGVNAIQKAQSRLLQASFSVDIARTAKFNKGTSTTERLADLGLTEDGKAFEAIRKHVEFDEDGFPTDFKFDAWDKDALDEFVYAMNREEAQLMPRVMSGELPVFMNKPIWQAIMQFRRTPLAFMSKGAQRNLQFADREAVLGTVLNSMTAGLTRYAKVALGIGVYTVISDSEWENPTLDRAKPWNYVSNLGIMGDAYSLSQSWSKTAQEKDGLEALWEGAREVPIVSGLDNAYNVLDGDPTAIKKAVPLNTLPLVNEVANAVIRNVEQN
jgi:hypothetical protein